MRPGTRSSAAVLIFGWLLLAPAPARTAELWLEGDLEDGDDPAYALSAPAGIAASPDGLSVYVAGFGEDALDVFARNPVSGELTHQAALRDGQGGVDGLAGVLSAAVSGDGRNVYAVGLVDEGVAIFTRDLATGMLSFAGQRKNGSGGVTGLSSPRSIVESPDAKHVYVACDAAVVVFARDAAGGLGFVQNVALPPLSGAQGIAVDPAGRNVYVGGYEFAELRVYARDPETGMLALLEVEKNGQAGASGLAGIDSIVVAADGNDVYANGTGDSSIVHFARDPKTGALAFARRFADGVGGIDGLGLSAGVCIGGDRGARVFAGGANAAVAVFERDRASGTLDFVSSVSLPGASFIGSGEQILAIGGNLYVANSIDNRVSIFGIAVLHFVDVEEDGIAGASGLSGAEGVAIEPNGRHLYATGSVYDAVTTFAIDSSNGALSASSVVTNGVGGVTGIDGALGIVVSPDARHVYAIGAANSTIAAFARDAESGALTFLESQQEGKKGVQNFLAPRVAAISPDGKQIYAAVFQSNAVTWFTRDTASGALSVGGSAKNGVAGVEGLGGAYSVTVTPDGRHVYAAGLNDDSIVALSRDAATGALVFASRVQDGVAGVDGLDAATAVAVSPDGRHVYATGFSDNAVAVFTRDAETGTLGFVERKRDGEAGVTRMAGPSYVAVSADGRNVIVSASADNAVNVFRRDPASGRLFLAQIEQDGEGGVLKLANPRGIAIARRGHATYVASAGDNAVTAFAPEPDLALLGVASLVALAGIRLRR